MNRRASLGDLAVGGTTAGPAGCLGALGGLSSPNTTLVRPDSQQADSEVRPYLAWGQRLPSAALTEPRSGELVSPNVCQRTNGPLRDLQADVVGTGYADDVAFPAMTFDPERDAADRRRRARRPVRPEPEPTVAGPPRRPAGGPGPVRGGR